MTKKGFLLIDSLLCVFIVVSLSNLCMQLYKSILKEDEGYHHYVIRDNDFYQNMYLEFESCEGCSIDESD